MRNYTQNHALGFGSEAGVGFIGKFLHNWEVRRAVRQLETFDDRMLQDIGVRREEVEWAADLPLSMNAALALEERRRSRLRKSKG